MNVRRAIRPSLVLSCIVAGLAFATPQAAAAQQRDPIPVVVENHAYLDMHIYVVHRGVVRSLGMVTGFSDATLDLPSDLSESGLEVQLLADPIGGFGSYLSPDLLFSPDDEIHLTIENNLNLSHAEVTPARKP